MAEPLLTCLLCVHNGEAFLAEAVTSVLAQTFQDFEFLIIDDASTDGTAAILAGFSDSRIRVVKNTENLGLTRSLNKGLQLAKGTWIARMDADDISLLERFEKQLAALTSSGADLAGSGLIIKRNSQPDVQKVYSDASFPVELLALQSTFPHSSIMVKKAVLQPGYDEYFRFSQDFECWSRLLIQGKKLIYLPEALVVVRMHAGQISSARRAEQEQFCGEIVQRNLREYFGITWNTDVRAAALLSGYYSGRVGERLKLRTFLLMIHVALAGLMKRKFSVRNIFNYGVAILRYVAKR